MCTIVGVCVRARTHVCVFLCLTVSMRVSVCDIGRRRLRAWLWICIMCACAQADIDMYDIDIEIDDALLNTLAIAPPCKRFQNAWGECSGTMDGLTAGPVTLQT